MYVCVYSRGLEGGVGQALVLSLVVDVGWEADAELGCGYMA